MVTIKYNLFALKHHLELKTGRAYPWTEVARQSSGVHITTVMNMAGNKTGRVDLENLARLISFFNQRRASRVASSAGTGQRAHACFE